MSPAPFAGPGLHPVEETVMPDTRTVLHALPEDQPDSLGVGTKSNPAHGTPAAPEGPDVTDPKADWVAYAEAEGHDVDGMTKSEIIGALSD